MNTDTPETDALIATDQHHLEDDQFMPASIYWRMCDLARKLECERDEWRKKFIQQNKDLGCEMMDPNGTIWDYAKKLQKDIAAINDRRDNFEENLRFELGGHPDSELWGDAGLIAATMRCVDALDVVTEQRDRLADALNKACANPTTGNWYREAQEALRSITPKKL